MIDKVKLHIPIHTPEQIVIRDEIAKTLLLEYEAVVLHLTEHLIIVNDKPMLFPVSIVEVYVKKVTDDELEYFKDLAVIISDAIGDSVTLEVTRESIYHGTTEIRED